MNSNMNNQNYYDYMNNYMNNNPMNPNFDSKMMPVNPNFTDKQDMANMMPANPMGVTKDYYNYNNNNYNKPNFSKNENPSTLYDPYAGFIRGNMFPSLYNEYKISKPYNIEPMNEQAELLTNVDILTFAASDIHLYLDIYPDDKDMLELFNQYRIEANKSISEYEKKYGPLTNRSDATAAYPWSWDNKPWPWENV